MVWWPFPALKKTSLLMWIVLVGWMEYTVQGLNPACCPEQHNNNCMYFIHSAFSHSFMYIPSAATSAWRTDIFASIFMHHLYTNPAVHKPQQRVLNFVLSLHRRQHFLKRLARCHEMTSWKLHGFNYNPEHIHSKGERHLSYNPSFGRVESEGWRYKSKVQDQ